MLLASLFAGPPALLQGTPSAQVRNEPAAERPAAASVARDLLLRALGGSREGAGALARELAALGPKAAPFLLQVLQRGGVPVPGSAGGELVVEIPTDMEESLLLAFARLPREPVLELLQAAAASRDVEERVAALRVLGWIGSREHFELLAALGRPVGTDALVAPAVRSAFQEALSQVLARDAKALSQVPHLYAQVAPALAFPTIRAVEGRSAAQAIESLATLLGVRSEADLFLLSELSRLAGTLATPTSPAVLQKTRSYLSETDPERLAAAVALAGAFEDHEAVEQLVRVVGNGEERLARCARTALKRIAGRDVGRRPEDWERWYRAEAEWWSTKSAATGAELRSGEPAAAAAAVLEIGRRRLRRHDAALLLAGGLQRPDADIVRMCCQALGHLRSPLVLPALEAVREHEEPKVREAVLDAIARIGESSGSRHSVRAAHGTD